MQFTVAEMQGEGNRWLDSQMRIVKLGFVFAMPSFQGSQTVQYTGKGLAKASMYHPALSVYEMGRDELPFTQKRKLHVLCAV